MKYAPCEENYSTVNFLERIYQGRQRLLLRATPAFAGNACLCVMLITLKKGKQHRMAIWSTTTVYAG